MAHHKSAIKRIRSSRRERLYNRANKKDVREIVKAVRTADDAGVARELLSKAYSVLDRVAARGVLHKNAAANRKSSLLAHVRRLEAARS